MQFAGSPHFCRQERNLHPKPCSPVKVVEYKGPGCEFIACKEFHFGMAPQIDGAVSVRLTDHRADGHFTVMRRGMF